MGSSEQHICLGGTILKQQVKRLNVEPINLHIALLSAPRDLGDVLAYYGI